jgi:hypothetical protein
MKNTAKKVGLILGCGFVLLGIVLMIAGLSISHFDMDRLYQRENQHFQNTYETPQKIFADLDDADIMVYTGNTDQVNVIADGIELDVSQRADGTLLIKNKSNWRKWYEFVELDWRTANVKIEVPTEYQGSLTLQSDYGKVNLQGLTVSGNLTVEKDDGALSVIECKVGGDMVLKQEYGATVLDQIAAKNLKLDFSDGNAELSHLTISEQMEVEGETGSLDLENVTAKSGLLGLEDGSMELNNTQYQGRVFMELEYGSIGLNDVTAQLLDFDVEDGDIEGILLGTKADYKVSTQIEDGESNLKTSHEGAKEIRAKIEYGNLNLRFENQ